MPRRWDCDDRWHGTGDAGQLMAGVHELVAAFAEPEWVAEEPELHLQPHIEAWCAQDERLSLVRAYSDETEAFVAELEWTGSEASVGEARAAVFSLIGSFAESATYVRQRRLEPNTDGSPWQLQFEVGTGELAPDARFAPHGHVLVIKLAGLF